MKDFNLHSASAKNIYGTGAGDFIVEGRALDVQQMACVTELNHNHLVVAGAGTGKTTTIIGKLKWLLAHGEFKPEEILVLSFTNASAAEMRERILAETNKPIMAATFHKLGLEIVKAVEPETKISKLSLGTFVNQSLSADERSYAENITRVINVARMENKDIAELRRQRKWKEDEELILRRTAEILEKYLAELRRAHEVDFTDMITLATKFVKTGRYRNPYKFVVVDEYQDISLARFQLLAALRESSDYDLFCVGDDWQAIYRFAGSEIDLILNFEKYWGVATLSKIETTYRFPQTLADASGKFVMENLAQITKKVKAIPDPEVPVLGRRGEPRKTLGGKVLTRPDFAVTEVVADSNAQTLEYAREILIGLPEDASVYFLGRYTRDVDFLGLMEGLGRGEKDALAGIPFVFSPRPDIKIRFLTAHKSKGLQADYIFALNLKDGKMGFPSKVESDAISEVLHGKAEKYPFAEERRLFYVTLTRAKKKIFLLTVHGHKSEFVLELEDLLYRKMPIVELGLLED